MTPLRLFLLCCLAALVGDLHSAEAHTYAITTLAGSIGEAAHADGTGASARFHSPLGIAVDLAGNVYVADTSNHTIRKITPTGGVSTLAGSPGDSGFANGAGSAARFFEPHALAIDPAGVIFAADKNGLRRITPDGLVSTVLQTFGYASGLALERDGSLLFTAPFYDNNGVFRGHRVRRRTVDGIVSNVSATPVGALNALSRVDLALAPDGVLYIVDDNAHAVQKLTPAGAVSTVAGYPGLAGTNDGTATEARFGAPSGLAVDTTGNLFVTDGGTTIRRIAPDGTVTTLAGQVGVHGSVDGIGGAARFDRLTGIAIDAAGNLYIVDAGSHTVRKGTPSAALSPPIVSNVAGSLTQNIAIGGDAIFTVAAAGPELRYQWSKNGDPLPGATSATLAFPRVTEADAGAYAVLVSNPAGSTTLQAGTLNVHSTTITSFTPRHARPGSGMLWSIVSGNGTLVAVGDAGTILTSADGRTWTRRNSGTTDWLVAVTYGAGQFVAVGDRGRILLSPDGVTWSAARASNTTHRLNNVLRAADIFVAVGEAGTILTSADAQTWTPRESGVTGWLRGLAFNPSPISRTYTNYFAFPSTPTFLESSPRAFSASGEGGMILTSLDGVTWLRSYGATSDIEALVPLATESNFVGIGQNGTATSLRRFGYVNSRIMPTGYYYLFSPAPHRTYAPLRLRGLAHGASALFATGENGTILAAPDVSGPWTRVPSGTTANLVGGIFHGNTLYVVGADETILQSDPLYISRLINISTRGHVGTDASALISGFVIQGSAPKQILLRAAGPALTSFGLSGALAAPVLTLFDGASRPIATNTRWSTATNAAAIATTTPRVGAFSFAADSADSALLLTLSPGAYTAQIAGANNTTGLSLVEVYDADPLSNEGSRAINISTRGQVCSGDARLIAGFVVNGAASRRVLIRAVGPSLATFGLAGTLTQPQLELFDHKGALHATARAWSQRHDADDIRHAAALSGAFALQPDGQDAALVATLLPGAYTVQVSGLNNTTGLALVEVYELP